MRLYLIRHPKPNATEGLCYGRLDVAVEPGLFATALAKVRQCIPVDILRETPIYTSPLSRCAVLARALAKPHTAVVAKELIEMDFGSWEGKSWNEVPREGLDNWARDIWRYHPGGGENARDLAIRWRRWYDRVALMRHEAVIAVTHAGIIRVALASAGRVAVGDLGRTSIEFGSVHCIDEAECAVESKAQIGADA
jgi:alpha-ribazole phosphatase